MTEEPGHPVPLLLKHPILERIDDVSRDPAKVVAMRDLLLSGACAAELADVAIRHGIVSRELADMMLATWANVGDHGWLGDIMTELKRGVLATADQLLSAPRPLSSWWMMGLTEDFRMLVVPTHDRLLLFMTTPRLPPALVASKTDPRALDTAFRPMLQHIRYLIDDMLARGAAPMPA
jgi:hypothetical protein